METERSSTSVRLIAVVSGNDQTRASIADALESMRSAKVVQFKTPEQVLAFHKLNQIDWIYSEVFRDEAYSAIDLLGALRAGEVNRTVKFSLFLNRPDDNNVLPRAFDLGLISFHAARYSQMDILRELGELQRLIGYYQNLIPLVAAHYLRTLLNETGEYDNRLALEQKLISLYPFHPDVLVYLAETEFVHGKIEDAVKHLRHAAAIAPAHAHRVETIREKFLSPAERAKLDEQMPSTPLFPVNSVIVVDSDLSVAQVIRQTLSKCGIQDIKHFQTGEAAIEHLKSGVSVDLVITEWRLAGDVSGSAMVQRVRKMGLGAIKVAVVSSLLKKSDEHLLDEIGVDAVVAKPLVQSAVLELMVTLAAMDKRPKNARSLQRKINALLSSNNIQQAEAFVTEFMNLDEADDGQKQEVLAAWLLANGEYANAVEKAALAMEYGRVNPGVMMIMGRSLLRLKDYQNAIQFLERAQIASPDGIERLLELAEARVAVNDLDGAATEVARALSIDPENEWVILAECSISIERGETKKASGLLARMASGKEMASMMNNRAVALAQMGKIDDGILLYVRTLEAMPTSWKSEIARVTYNLGLAHIRNGAYGQAEKVLRDVSEVSREIQQRARDLADKCKRAVEGGKTLSIQSSDDMPTDTKKQTPRKVEIAKIIARVDIRPGDIGLMGIFKCEKKSNSANSDFLDRRKLSGAIAS
jgi:tetratricopeptide (TPR) repeat protein